MSTRTGPCKVTCAAVGEAPLLTFLRLQVALLPPVSGRSGDLLDRGHSLGPCQSSTGTFALPFSSFLVVFSVTQFSVKHQYYLKTEAISPSPSSLQHNLGSCPNTWRTGPRVALDHFGGYLLDTDVTALQVQFLCHIQSCHVHLAGPAAGAAGTVCGDVLALD